MPFNSIRFLFIAIFVLFSSIFINAQNTGSGITMELQKGSASKSRLLNMVVIIHNQNEKDFMGRIHFVFPKGFKIISGEEPAIELKAKEKKYIPVRVIVSTDAMAGSSPLKIQLFDNSGNLINEQIKDHTIEVNNDITLSVLNSVIYRSSKLEPLSVKVRIANSGNITQDITLVCKIPDPANGNLFLEQQAVIKVKKDSVFTFTYEPSKSLSRLSNFSINISGFRNPEKEIFSTATIFVQNISNVQKYQDPQFSNFFEETKNEVTASYRKIGENSNMYQLMGSGGFNLPSGYLYLRGNIALLDNQQHPLITNTNIALQQGKNQYTIGSVNKLLEMTLVGRGVEYSHAFEKNKKIEIGFVDQNFNLAEKNSFLKNGYGFFTKGTLNTNNGSKNISAAYIYRYDPFEKSGHNILGTEINYIFDKKWVMNGKINAGLSSYEQLNFWKPSFSAETNYIGVVKNFNVNGNYFYSSDYYPGNRRGSMQLQQNISTNIKNYNLFTNLIFSNFSPKFYFFNNGQVSDNSRIEIGTKFPKVRDFTFGLIYQYQNEHSNSYNNFFGSQKSSEIRQLMAHRIVEQISWSNYKTRQSAVLAVETGTVKYPMQESQKFQMKLNANYSFRNFNLSAIYQSGSYYLSEYAFSHLANQNTDYKKLMLSLFYNNNFIKDKLIMSTGISYVNDIIYGKSPSAFINARYNAKTFSAFLNSSWYNYSVGTLKNNILTVEVGVTINLRKNLLNPGKKAKIQVFAFYDENNNYIFDPEEKPARDYIVNINNIALKTASDGTAMYKNVPFGEYRLRQFIQQGWYYDEYDFNVNRYSYALNIPLHQNGTLHGKISFNYNSKTAVDFEHRASLITFSIMKDDKVIQRVASDDEGQFTTFIPTGNYTIVLDEKSLPENTYCETKTQQICVEAGKISFLPDFTIKVKEKKVNKKTFSN